MGEPCDPGIRTVEIQDSPGVHEYFAELCRTGKWELLVTKVELVGVANKRLLVTFAPSGTSNASP